METQAVEQPSILSIYNDSKLKNGQADDAWIGLARQLAERMPKDLHLFARKTLWVKVNPGDKWLLPMFLENLIQNGIRQKPISMPFSKNAIFKMGFENSQDFMAKIMGLQTAWFGLVTIDTYEKDDTIDVIFMSTET